MPQGRATIEPFWERLPALFGYGLHPAALATIAAYAVGMAVVSLLPSVVAFLAWLVVISTLFSQCFQILETTGRGRLQPPDVSLEAVGGGLFWKQLGLWLVVGLLVVQSFKTLPALLAVIVAGGLISALPAMTVVLAFDQSLIAALNPSTLIAFVTRIGKPYALLCLLLLGMMVVLWLSGRVTTAVLSGFFGVLVVAALNAYFLIVTFHLLGYVVYQYHAAFGLDLEEDELEAAEAEQDETLARAQAFIEAGRLDEARQLLADAVSSRGGSVALHLAFHRTLAGEPYREKRRQHAHSLVAMLMNAEREAEALAAAREAMADDPTFEISDGDWVTRLGRRSLKGGDHRTTLKLFNNFARRFPQHPEILENYLTIARILCEREGKDAEALDLLRRMRKTFPDHPRKGEIDDYLATVEQLVEQRS